MSLHASKSVNNHEKVVFSKLLFLCLQSKNPATYNNLYNGTYY